MDDLVFPDHALDEMARDQITEDGVYHVAGDADDIFRYHNGRTEYVGIWDDRTFSVIVERDGETVVTVFEHKRRRRRRR